MRPGTLGSTLETGVRKQEVDWSEVGSRQAVEHRWATELDWIGLKTVWVMDPALQTNSLAT